jgi:hypothetical protein
VHILMSVIMLRVMAANTIGIKYKKNAQSKPDKTSKGDAGNTH